MEFHHKITTTCIESYRRNISSSGAPFPLAWRFSCWFPNVASKHRNPHSKLQLTWKIAESSKPKEHALSVPHAGTATPRLNHQLTTARIPRGQKHVNTRSTALNYTAWENELPQDYEHRNFLLTGIKNGFHIVDPENITNMWKWTIIVPQLPNIRAHR